MNHEAHEDVFATKDTKFAKAESRSSAAVSTRATAARSAGCVERLLVSFVPLVAKVVDREISVIAVAADVSL